MLLSEVATNGPRGTDTGAMSTGEKINGKNAGTETDKPDDGDHLHESVLTMPEGHNVKKEMANLVGSVANHVAVDRNNRSADPGFEELTSVKVSSSTMGCIHMFVLGWSVVGTVLTVGALSLEDV